jgi:hypothetical protein
MTSFLQKQKEKTEAEEWDFGGFQRLRRGSKDNVLRRGLGRQPLLN